MPFTPFHFGPGAAFKGAAATHFSFTLFCYAQVVTDLEPGYYLLTGQYPVHRFFHSFPGATVTAVFCALTGRPLCRFALRVWQDFSPGPLNSWFVKSTEISWRTAFITAFMGTYSHVVLDGIMHRDVTPFMPFTAANPLLHIVSVGALHLLCVMLGVTGVLVWAFRRTG